MPPIYGLVFLAHLVSVGRRIGTRRWYRGMSETWNGTSRVFGSMQDRMSVDIGRIWCLQTMPDIKYGKRDKCGTKWMIPEAVMNLPLSWSEQSQNAAVMLFHHQAPDVDCQYGPPEIHAPSVVALSLHLHHPSLNERSQVLDAMHLGGQLSLGSCAGP